MEPARSSWTPDLPPGNVNSGERRTALSSGIGDKWLISTPTEVYMLDLGARACICFTEDAPSVAKGATRIKFEAVTIWPRVGSRFVLKLVRPPGGGGSTLYESEPVVGIERLDYSETDALLQIFGHDDPLD